LSPIDHAQQNIEMLSILNVTRTKWVNNYEKWVLDKNPISRYTYINANFMSTW